MCLLAPRINAIKRYMQPANKSLFVETEVHIEHEEVAVALA